MVKDAFNACMNNPSLLPASWSAKQEVLPVVVGDYIAGMTDKFVINMHKTLNNRVTSSTLLAE
jgi:dGTP triphosphohydrolase